MVPVTLRNTPCDLINSEKYVPYLEYITGSYDIGCHVTVTFEKEFCALRLA